MKNVFSMMTDPEARDLWRFEDDGGRLPEPEKDGLGYVSAIIGTKLRIRLPIDYRVV